MSNDWRLLDDGINDAYHHFAVEEALARLVDEDHAPPTLRLRRVRPAVFVGAYQDTWAEVDVSYCRSQGIQVVRRANGGGAVYHEMGSFCFSAFFKRAIFPQTDEELYRLFARPVIRTCEDYRVKAYFHGRNDVQVGERKIYGSAQLSWYTAFVQSGTLLVNMDFEVMERALTPPALKFSGKSARSIRERVTSLSREAGRELDTREVMRRFTSHAAGTLGINLYPGELTAEERELADELLAVKYSTDAWNLGTQSSYQVTVAERCPEGVVTLSADMQGDTIQIVQLRGDILLSDCHGLDDLEKALTGSTLRAAQATTQSANLSAGLRETIARLLNKLGREVAEQSNAVRKENTP